MRQGNLCALKLLQGYHGQGQGKNPGNENLGRSWEKSGNFNFSQGNLEKMKKVMNG